MGSIQGHLREEWRVWVCVVCGGTASAHDVHGLGLRARACRQVSSGGCLHGACAPSARAVCHFLAGSVIVLFLAWPHRQPLSMRSDTASCKPSRSATPAGGGALPSISRSSSSRHGLSPCCPVDVCHERLGGPAGGGSRGPSQLHRQARR